MCFSFLNPFAQKADSKPQNSTTHIICITQEKKKPKPNKKEKHRNSFWLLKTHKWISWPCWQKPAERWHPASSVVWIFGRLQNNYFHVTHWGLICRPQNVPLSWFWNDNAASEDTGAQVDFCIGQKCDHLLFSHKYLTNNTLTLACVD